MYKINYLFITPSVPVYQGCRGSGIYIPIPFPHDFVGIPMGISIPTATLQFRIYSITLMQGRRNRYGRHFLQYLYCLYGKCHFLYPVTSLQTLHFTSAGTVIHYKYLVIDSCKVSNHFISELARFVALRRVAHTQQP